MLRGWRWLSGCGMAAAGTSSMQTPARWGQKESTAVQRAPVVHPTLPATPPPTLHPRALGAPHGRAQLAIERVPRVGRELLVVDEDGCVRRGLPRRRTGECGQQGILGGEKSEGGTGRGTPEEQEKRAQTFLGCLKGLLADGNPTGMLP